MGTGELVIEAESPLGEFGDFCEACSPLNISITSFTSDTWKERRAHQLGRFRAIEGRKSCPLCQLIANAYREGPVYFGSRGLGVSSSLESVTIHGSWQKPLFEDDGAVITLSIHEEMEAGGTMLSLRPLLMTGTGKHPPNYFARVLNGTFISYDMTKEWLRGCEESHLCCNSIPSVKPSIQYRRPTAFKCIDVRKLCVVEPLSRCRYLTLSYVWGPGAKYVALVANINALSTVGGLNVCWARLSPTIKDAITLTQKLGERYLWVDSLCIVQDSPQSEKQAVLEDMDLIYRQAILGICAADDRCVANGLRGISHPRDEKQNIGKISQALTLAAVFDVSAYLELSLYRSRGWTYQEEQLAQRQLIFINDQVYFRCLRGTYTEELYATPATTATKSQREVDETRPSDASGGLHAANYFKAVQNYTGRDLTYPSDILNAFRGVMSFQATVANWSTFVGLPCAIFDNALLWQPFQKSSRRPGFPSWSWAGWFGSAEWRGDTMELSSYGNSVTSELEHHKITVWTRSQTWIVWYRFMKSEKLQMPANPGSQTEALIPTKTSLVPLNGHEARESSPSNPYARTWAKDKPPLPGIHLSNSPPKVSFINSPSIYDTLSFSTLSAKFRIRPSNAYLRYGSIDPVWEARGRIVFLLINRHNAICGYVLLDDTWGSPPSSIDTALINTASESEAKKLEPLHEFILLSKANYRCEWGRPHVRHPYTHGLEVDAYIEVHVMMVTWKDGVAERAGVGRIHQEALADPWEGPVWKDILLG